MAQKVISKLQQNNDEQFNLKPNFYIVDAKDIQFETTDTNGTYYEGKPGDGNDLETIIKDLREQISGIGKFNVIQVDELPEVGAVNTIYSIVTDNSYAEYVYSSTNKAYIKLLSNQFDTSAFATKTWVEKQKYLTTHQNLTNLVTLNTAQNITKNKTFTNGITLGNQKSTYKDNPKLQFKGIVTSYLNTESSGNFIFNTNGTATFELSDKALLPRNYESLGSETYHWSDIYLTGSIKKNNVTITIPNKSGTIILNNDIKTVAKTGSYNDLLNIPKTFTPSAHVHKYSDLTDISYSDGVISSTVNEKTIIGLNLSYKNNGKNYAIKNGTDGLYVNVPWTDTKYTHPTYDTETIGFYKFGVENGHIVNIGNITKNDIINLGIPGTDTKYLAGTGLKLTNNVFSATQASKTNLGSVIIGNNIDVDSAGTISVNLSKYLTSEALTNYATIQNVIDSATNTIKTIRGTASTSYDTLGEVENVILTLKQKDADIETKIDKINTTLNTYLDGSDDTLDQISEIVSYIKENRDTLTELQKLQNVKFIENDSADLSSVVNGSLVINVASSITYAE